MEWACHIAELRLWLALIIDAEFTREELHLREEPLLPHFSFKIRCGDSLVQEVGGINLGHIRGAHEVSPRLKARITQLKNEKLKFYNNDPSCKYKRAEEIEHEELRLFHDMAARSLRLYRQFFLTYENIWQALPAKLRPQRPGRIREGASPRSGVAVEKLFTRLSFSHFAELIAIDDPLKRAFYEVECIRGHWSR